MEIYAKKEGQQGEVALTLEGTSNNGMSRADKHDDHFQLMVASLRDGATIGVGSML